MTAAVDHGVTLGLAVFNTASQESGSVCVGGGGGGETRR